MQHIAKDKVTGGTVSISQDLSLLWPQISNSHPKNPKFIGIIYWAGFGRMKVLGQGPVVSLRIITRHTCPAQQGLLVGHELQCLVPVLLEILWWAWVWFSPSANILLSLPRGLGAPQKLQGSSGPSQKGSKRYMGNDWMPSTSHGWRLIKFYLSLRPSQWKELSTGLEIFELRPKKQHHAAFGTVNYMYRLRPSGQGYKVSWSICEHISALHWCKHFTQTHHQ